MFSEKTKGDLLFGFQVFLTFCFCIPQIQRSFSAVAGVSAVQFALVAAFTGLNLWLATDGYRANASRGNAQLVATYVIWVVLSVIMCATVLTNRSYHWNVKETTMLATAVISTVVLYGVAHYLALPIRDPMMKALLAIAYKAIPQVLLIWVVATGGSRGIPLLTIIIGHATIGFRILQLRRSNEGRVRFWLAVSEWSNEATWALVTAVWTWEYIHHL